MAVDKPRYFKLPEPANRREQPKEMPSWKRPETEWANQLHKTARWQKLRLQILARHPTCIMDCGALAEEVHRIDPHDPEAFFDPRNLVPVCSECHSKINSAYRRGISTDILFPADKRLKPEDVT